jgi:putative DNA primase/helicase
MSAAYIAAALGNARRAGEWWRCICPVHGSRTGRSPSLSLRDHPRGLAVRCHAGCSRDDVIAELRRMGLLAGRGDGARSAPVAYGDNRDDTRRITAARRVWDAARDARGSPVARYLASRGITVPVPPSLRWAPSCRHPSGIFLPAMVARVVNIDGELIGLHRTFVRPDGSGKADIEPQKAMLGRAAGGAVRLAPTAKTLMVAEGIETALAAMQATAQPAWAALSTSGMAALLLPAEVRSVIILADYDCSGAGERAARTAAQRWLAEGRRIRIAMPPGPGTDFADVLAGRAHPRIEEARDAAA